MRPENANRKCLLKRRNQLYTKVQTEKSNMFFKKSCSTSKVCLLWVSLISLWAEAVRGAGMKGELYSSMVHVAELFTFDQVLGRVVTKLQNHNSYASMYVESHKWLMKDSEQGDMTGHPLHVYSLFKRLALLWPSVATALEAKGLYNQVRKQVSQTPLPSNRDLRGAALALARLQHVYDLQTEDIVTGRIDSWPTSVKLTVHDCMRIANESLFEKEFSNSYIWYQQALALANDPDIKDNITKLMHHVAIKHDEDHAINKQHFAYRLAENPNQLQTQFKYFQLCQGISYLSAEDQARLQCHVSSRGSPHLLLQPIKYEVLHYDPEILLFYDVLTPDETLLLQRLSKDHLRRAGIHTKAQSDENRVAKLTWLYNSSHPFLQRLSRRFSSITGLHVHEGSNWNYGSEPLQVQSYGVGGHYLMHYDPLYKTSTTKPWKGKFVDEKHYVAGDRLATLMIYLSEVTAGGRTAFYYPGISVPPVEGGAVFWYNFHRNGQLDPRTLHAGCPVLIGHKWAANKWIHEGVNFQRRLCSTNPDL